MTKCFGDSVLKFQVHSTSFSDYSDNRYSILFCWWHISQSYAVFSIARCLFICTLCSDTTVWIELFVLSLFFINYLYLLIWLGWITKVDVESSLCSFLSIFNPSELLQNWNFLFDGILILHVGKNVETVEKFWKGSGQRCLLFKKSEIL